MKALICTTLALVLAAPAVSFAQTTDQPVTRAQVRADRGMAPELAGRLLSE
jgi:hypothetical protein